MLNNYKKNKYYSQDGEDGIIEEVLNRLEKHIELDKWCSEFGAWDGVHLSNTCFFIKEKNYKAILIEGNKDRIKDLKKNFPSERVKKIHRFVSFEGQNTLDSIFTEQKISIDFDFLSIDVDGVDYHIFDSLNKYKPKIICVEFNPFIPNMVSYVQPKDMNIKYGNSAKAIVELAIKKNYTLIASTNSNLIFLRKELLKFVIDFNYKLEELNPKGNEFTCIFSGYDGTILSNKKIINLPWHRVPVPINEKLQFLPKFLRIFIGDYGFLRKCCLAIYVLIRLPNKIIQNGEKAIARLIDLFRPKN